MTKTYGELFAGIGGASVGLKAAGYHGSWAVEHNQGAIDILAANHDIDRIIHDDVCEVDYNLLPDVDVLWASPPCPSFSRANHKGGETWSDMELAHAIVAAATRAQSVIIENVPTYRESRSFATIDLGLISGGFTYSTHMILNASDYGNRSSRSRFYAIFSRSRFAPINLPQSRSWWFGALLDAIDHWEPSKLTVNQTKAIEVAGVDLATSMPFAIERCGYYGSPKLIATGSVFPCCKSHPGHDGKNPKTGRGKIGSYRRQYDFVYQGQSYALTHQLMGLLMGFPINYDWGADRGQAVAGIGNAVVPAMAELLARSIG